jgi:hypothetical protein
MLRAPYRLCFAIAFAAGAISVLAYSGLGSAAPVPGATAKFADSTIAARRALDEVVDLNYQGRSLNDVVADMKDKLKVPVAIDPLIYQFGFDPTQPTITLNVKQVKFRDGIKAALSPFNLRFGFTREGVLISTEDGLIARQLRQRVTVDCDGTAFTDAVKVLAADTGANIVVDPRLKDKAKVPVILKLEDVPLETAIRLLAEVADLRAIRMNNVLFVTSNERAEKLRADADGPVPSPQANPGIQNQILQGMIGGFGIVGGGAIGVPAVAPPAPPAPVEAPAPVEEKKAAPVEEKKEERKP